MSEFDFQHAYEVCPHCNEEVMLEPELKVQTCPNCGMRIVTCSMCRACETGENYCSKCCLEYQAQIENEEMEAERKLKLANQFSEVRCDFFDEVTGCWCVDAWGKYVDDGEVVAKINPETLEVTYNSPDYAKDRLVREVIKDKMREILK
jgi:predicted RNA-binding Zn-ribbon protein involved in translation (DUF1610 family)